MVSSAARTAGSRLRRFCHNIPLPQLVPGSHLIIRSRRPEQARHGEDPSSLPTTNTVEPTMYHNSIPIHVILEPSWRDHGHLEFRQYFPHGNTTTSTLVHQHPKIQMVVQPSSPTPSNSNHTSSSNSLSQKPQVTIDLLVPYTDHRHDDETTTTASTTSSNNSDYYHKNIAALPKTPESVLEDSSKWMEEVVVDDSDEGEDSTTYDHRNRPTATSGDTTYVVLTLQVPEQLNVTCTLLHQDHHDHHHPGADPIDISSTGRDPRTDRDPTDYCDDPTTNKSSITIRNKIEGDFLHLHNTHGNISVTKLRAHDMTLQSTNGVIYASNLLEAQRLTLQCSSGGGDHDQSRIRAKQIHASQVDITVDQRKAQSTTTCTTTNTTNAIGLMDPEDDEGSLVDISSLFVSGPNGGASITVQGPNHNKAETTTTLSPQHQRLRRRAVRIKSHHGPIQVQTNRLSKPIEKNPTTQQCYPIVELGGVNGSCEVSIHCNNTDDPTMSRTNLSPMNDDEVIDDEWSSCQIHIDSFAPDSVSLVTADTGHIDITLDRKVEADLRLASLLANSGSECINEVGALLAEEDDNHHIVNILSHLPSSNSSTEIVNHDPSSDERILIQTSAFTNRPENALSSRNVTYMDGWVENKSSEPDSRFERKNRGHEGVGKIRLDGAHTQALHSFTGGEGSRQDHVEHTDHHRPLLAVVGTNDICVETVSWIGAIARRYGLDESGRELGRTASRKGRAIESEPRQ